jgi:F-type H+-transporting ATPase subunit epsilon
MDTPEPVRALQLEICALDRAPFRTEAALVSVPGSCGLFTVLPGHAPLMSTLEIGVLKAVYANGEQHLYAISGGVVRVLNDQVLILTETAESETDIDLARAEEARERAEQRLRLDGMNEARAEIALKRAIARIRARTQSSPPGKRT